eukprot:scaffold331_cov349-Prasinococcus_capsulatus_cf.AAC.3
MALPATLGPSGGHSCPRTGSGAPAACGRSRLLSGRSVRCPSGSCWTNARADPRGGAGLHRAARASRPELPARRACARPSSSQHGGLLLRGTDAG